MASQACVSRTGLATEERLTPLDDEACTGSVTQPCLCHRLLSRWSHKTAFDERQQVEKHLEDNTDALHREDEVSQKGNHVIESFVLHYQI